MVSAGGRALYSAHCDPGPENAHLSDARSQRSKSGQCPTHGRSTVWRSRKASPSRPKAMSRRSSTQLPKNLTVTSAVSKIPMASNTYVLQRIRLCRTVVPRKTSPLCANTELPTSKFAPEKAHLCRKRAQKNGDFSRARRAFRRYRPAITPEKPHLCAICVQIQLPKKLTSSAFARLWNLSRRSSPYADRGRRAAVSVPKTLTFAAPQPSNSAFGRQNRLRFPEILTSNRREVP